MNYRHAYHAGNFADVHKHVFLLALLQYLQKKPTPLCMVDSHAGCGFYDLGGREAQTSLEFKRGIGALLKTSPEHPWLQQYLATVQQWRQEQQHPEGYPGSPVFCQRMRRAQDRHILMELQPEEAATLKRWARAMPCCQVHQRDAWEGLHALLPPAEHRGLVLIDPPYESEQDSLAALVQHLETLLNRWPQGVYLLWLPIKDLRDLQHLQHRLERKSWPAAVKEILLAQLCLYTPDNTLGLNGSALLLINPPWQFAEQAERCQQELWQLLSPNAQGMVLLQPLLKPSANPAAIAPAQAPSSRQQQHRKTRY